MNKVILLGLVATAALGGCGLFGSASPHRKPGFWEQSLQTDRSPTPIVTKWCFDEASDKLVPVLGRAPRGGAAGPPPKYSLSRNGDSYVIDISRSVGSASFTVHTVISGDFTQKYTSVSTIDVEGATDPARNGKHTSTTTWTYQGADCPSELGPGQMERPNGDVVDMAAMRAAGGGGGGGGGNSTGGNSTGGNSTGGNSTGGNTTAPAPSGGGGQ